MAVLWVRCRTGSRPRSRRRCDADHTVAQRGHLAKAIHALQIRTVYWLLPVCFDSDSGAFTASLWKGQHMGQGHPTNCRVAEGIEDVAVELNASDLEELASLQAALAEEARPRA